MLAATRLLVLDIAHDEHLAPRACSVVHRLELHARFQRRQTSFGQEPPDVPSCTCQVAGCFTGADLLHAAYVNARAIPKGRVRRDIFQTI